MPTVDPRLLSAVASALELPPGPDRDAFLDRTCADDPELRNRADALLRAHDAAGRFLEPADASPTVTLASSGPTAGRVLADRYRLLEKIGEGGMGQVWLADQTDPVHRKVAVKLIKAGADSAQVLARFDAERQALALMDHPNIAKVLDGGLADDGRPFFVMELVKGTPITKYCDDHRLGIPERLALFADVCRAVQHAHQKGIIHRDLKPSNVLVAPYDGRPVAKVIDFGVAKSAGLPLTERTLFTGFGAVVGTPEYMSPEQAELNNQDVDTRSDVYSLGVLLYELLTGTTPLTRRRVKEAALLEVLRLVREEEPPRPSSRLSGTGELPSIAAVRGAEPRQLAGLLRQELDWIALRALEKDRNRRYESANGLAEDVARFLAGERVHAVPPSAGYRFGKFVRRNRGPVAFATAVILLLVTGVVVSTWQARRATDARDEAEGERNTARQERDAAVSARQAEQRERLRAESILQFFEDKIIGQASPIKQASRDFQPDRNVKLVTILDRAAREIDSAFGDDPAVGGSLRKTIAECYLALGEMGPAVPLLERALELARQAYGADHHFTLNTIGGLAAARLHQGRFAEAERLLVPVVATGETAYPAGDPGPLVAQVNLAMAYDGQGKRAEAVAVLTRAVEAFRTRFGDDYLETVIAMNNLGLLHQRRRQHDRAEEWFVRAIESGRRAQGEASALALTASFNLLTGYLEQGKNDRAEPYVEPLLKHGPRTFGESHPRMVQIWTHVGELLIATKDDARLEPVLKKMMEFGPAVWGENHPQTYLTVNEMGLLRIRQERYAEAEPLIGRALDGMSRLRGRDSPEALIGINSLIHVLEKQDKHAAAEPLHRRRLETERKKKDDRPEPIQAAYTLARCLVRQKKHAEAEGLLRESLAGFEKLKMPPWVAGSKRLLGEALAGQKKYPEAEPLLVAAYEEYKALEATTKDRAAVVVVVEALVRFYDDWGQKEKADAWRKALAELRPGKP